MVKFSIVFTEALQVAHDKQGNPTGSVVNIGSTVLQQWATPCVVLWIPDTGIADTGIRYPFLLTRRSHSNPGFPSRRRSSMAANQSGGQKRDFFFVPIH